MLRQDLTAPRKQQHTARRVLARLVDEHAITDVSYWTVRDYVAKRRPEIQTEAGRVLEQAFVPQSHAQYTLATRLVNELVEAADEMTLNKTIARYGRVDLLCIDELGYMELDRRGAELLFQVLTEREEKNSVAIASNESFSGWTKTFTDPRLCAAIVDRLTFGGNIIETGTNSYRLARTLAQRAG